jgi:hypothetical protein
LLSPCSLLRLSLILLSLGPRFLIFLLLSLRV